MVYPFPDAVIMIFCKAPIPGQVKTRLMAGLTAQEAVSVHRELSIHTLQLAVGSQLCPVQLWCAPSTGHSFFQTAATDYGVALRQQRGEDLGERMHGAFCHVLQDHAYALIIGCDCPSLTAADLRQALLVLDGRYDSVVAPTEDGGYSLIGLSQPVPELFRGIRWGTSCVLQQTRERIRNLRLGGYELPEQWDVDTPADLARYRYQKNLK